jgi:hypothetical protein
MPDAVRPRGTSAATIMSEIGPQLEAMDRAIGEAEVRYGSSVCLVDHPVLGPLTGKQWRKFHWVHGRHHVKQIERLKQRIL